MRREINIISATIALSFALNSCNPFEPQSSVLAAPIEPTATLPSPTDIPPVLTTPTPIEIIPTPTLVIEPYPYFNQRVFGDMLTEDKSKMSEVGCGVAVGAMVTRTDPKAYLDIFNNYFKSINLYGPARITKLGSYIEDHIAVLNSLGYKTDLVSTPDSSMDSIKAKIQELSKQGVGFWIATNFYHGRHQSLAIGLSENNEIIFDDPFYGQNVIIPDSKIQVKDDKGDIVWKVYAVYPLEK